MKRPGKDLRVSVQDGSLVSVTQLVDVPTDSRDTPFLTRMCQPVAERAGFKLSQRSSQRYLLKTEEKYSGLKLRQIIKTLLDALKRNCSKRTRTRLATFSLWERLNYPLYRNHT